MKKILSVFLVLGVMMAVSGFAMAVVTGPQSITTVVSETSTIEINPSEINFGNVIPGTPAELVNAINFSAGDNSNEDMSIAVTSVTGVFANHIMVSEGENAPVLLESFTDTLECITNG